MDDRVYKREERQSAKDLDDAVTVRTATGVMQGLNEAAARRRRKASSEAPRDGDIGAIYGIGFPAFRGGPLRMIDDFGAARVIETLYELQDRYGERFGPAPALAEMARQGGRHYPA